MSRPYPPVVPVLQRQGPRIVMIHGGVEDDSHESVTQWRIAERLAALLDLPFGGPCGNDGRSRAGAYLVPRRPLAGVKEASLYGIGSEDDLFGSWVPQAWMATKAIVHPLASTRAVAPVGWTHALAEEATALTLPGFTALTREDALLAGRQLLRLGALRLKPAGADGGRGQAVVRNLDELAAQMRGHSPGGRLADPLVLEQDLEAVRTYSVGEVRLPGRVIAYCGTQYQTSTCHGQTAYGGSRLFAVRGRFGALLSCALPPEMLDAVRKAIAFDMLVDRHVPDLIASRRNYDVVCGIDAQGNRRSGVLEQSWRSGGATPAEIAAFEIFARDPARQAVRACSAEIHAGGHVPPEGATIYFRGKDPQAGPLLKYAWTEEEDD